MSEFPNEDVHQSLKIFFLQTGQTQMICGISSESALFAKVLVYGFSHTSNMFLKEIRRCHCCCYRGSTIHAHD